MILISFATNDYLSMPINICMRSLDAIFSWKQIKLSTRTVFSCTNEHPHFVSKIIYYCFKNIEIYLFIQCVLNLYNWSQFIINVATIFYLKCKKTFWVHDLILRQFTLYIHVLKKWLKHKKESNRSKRINII